MLHEKIIRIFALYKKIKRSTNIKKKCPFFRKPFLLLETGDKTDNSFSVDGDNYPFLHATTAIFPNPLMHYLFLPFKDHYCKLIFNF